MWLANYVFDNIGEERMPDNEWLKLNSYQI